VLASPLLYTGQLSIVDTELQIAHHFRTQWAQIYISVQLTDIFRFWSQFSSLNLGLDSPLLHFQLKRRLRATVLLPLLGTVSSQSSICVAHHFRTQWAQIYISVQLTDIFRFLSHLSSLNLVPDSSLLHFLLKRRLRATVLLPLLGTVSSQSFICVAHLSFCIQP